MRSQAIADCGIQGAAGFSLRESRITNPLSLFTLVLLLSFPAVSLADYVGLEVIDRSDLTICKDPSEQEIPYRLDVCDLVAIFDNPDDRLVSVAFSNVSTTDTNGFYQHTLNGDTAPGCNLIPLFPTLVCDSFVTVGAECDADGSSTDPDFDSTAFNSAGKVNGGWFNSSPANGEGNPDANGRVLIARLSYKQNKTASGDICVFAKLDGSEVVQEILLQPFDCSVPGMQAGTGGGSHRWFVDETELAGNGCTTWDDACPDLQTALGLAISGDQIWVAQGTYVPSDCNDEPPACALFDRLRTFFLIDGVAIYGGFVGGETALEERDPEENETILSGDLNRDDATIGNGENSYHVVTGSFVGTSAILDGFTITAGHANGTGGFNFCFLDPEGPPCGSDADCASPPCVSEQSIGGGMIAKGEGSSPTVSNCTFSGNIAEGAGAGMYNGFSSPTITDCTFSANLSARGAGALCNNFGSDAIVTNCMFIDNTATTAGGMANLGASNATVTRCIFIGNSGGQAGAFYNNVSDPTITDCIFIGNTGGTIGGGMINTGSSPTVTNCIFSGNKAINSGGGGIHSTTNSSATITNSLFVGNTARTSGAGMDAKNDDSSTLTNCTFAANSATGDSGNGGGIRASGTSNLTLDNCVFWDNSDSGPQDESAQIFVNVGNTATLTYTDIEGLVSEGQFCELCGDPEVCCNGPTPNGNIGADPAFVGGVSDTWTATAVYCSPTCVAPGCTDCDDPLIEVGQTLFTDGFASFGGIKGNFLNPDTAQFLQSLIVSNTATTITVWGDFADLGAVGKTYQVNDYRLDSAASSPCIDAADNNTVSTCGLDLDGNERRVDDLATIDTGNGELPIVDMGAYEFGSVVVVDCNANALDDVCEVAVPLTLDCNLNGTPDDCDIASGDSCDDDHDGVPDECQAPCGTCPTDANADGETGAFDLATLLVAWGPVGTGNCLDANDDLDIGALDLAVLLANWGPCP